jgi:hypothetical protein
VAGNLGARPCPLDVAVNGRIAGRPWRSAVDFNEAPTLMRHLTTASVIVCAYLTGARPGNCGHECVQPHTGERAIGTNPTRPVEAAETSWGRVRLDVAHHHLLGSVSQIDTCLVLSAVVDHDVRLRTELGSQVGFLLNVPFQRHQVDVVELAVIPKVIGHVLHHEFVGRGFSGFGCILSSAMSFG